MKEEALKNEVRAVLADVSAYCKNNAGTEELLLAMQDLQKTLESGGEDKAPDDLVATLLVEDLSKFVDSRLSPAAQAAMAKKSKSLIVVDKATNETFKCVYFGIRIRNENIPLAARKMADIANDLASRGLIYSTLCPISSIQLAKMPCEAPTSVVALYVLVPIAMADHLSKTHEHSIQEGECPLPLGDISLLLEPGEFVAAANIRHILHLKENGSPYDISADLFGIVQEYLQVLPPGTKFLGANKCAMISLAVPYELHFYNPLLVEVKKIEMDHVRSATMVSNDKIEGFHLLTEVRYFGADGKRLFDR